MSRSALVVIDMINSYGHADADVLVRSAEEAVPRIAGLVPRADGTRTSPTRRCG